MALLQSCAQPPSPTLPVSCATKCVQRFQHCAETCYNNCPACKRISSLKTEQDYVRYVRMQRAQGEVVAREFESYRDPLGCMKVTCDCPADYELCKQVCHGRVKAELQDQFCSYPVAAVYPFL